MPSISFVAAQAATFIPNCPRRLRGRQPNPLIIIITITTMTDMHIPSQEHGLITLCQLIHRPTVRLTPVTKVNMTEFQACGWSWLVPARQRVSPYPMVSVKDALVLILQEIQTLKPQELPVNSNLRGCVLAEDVIAISQIPPTPTSNVDGYALRCTSIRALESEVFGFLIKSLM